MATKKKTPRPKSGGAGNMPPNQVAGPMFGQPTMSPDPVKFTVKHGSDAAAYKILDAEPHRPPVAFPAVEGVDEPVLALADALGSQGGKIVSEIGKAGQIVFHALGDSGNTRGPKDEGMVADKMVSDYQDSDPTNVPSFFYHLGDIIYSFGEAEYYYDQFYDPWRDYPAPIFAIPGNHDGMVAPGAATPSLQAFLDNFCAAGKPIHQTSQAGGLVRTAQIQPGVYFTLEAPFLRILGLYSNCLEDPGVISTQGGTYPSLTDVQLTFLKTALKRVKSDNFKGALLIAVHHPPYVAIVPTTKTSGKHGNNPAMLKDIDAACSAAGVWPHAVLSGHAHNYQRFTRKLQGRETPFMVAGNGGHGMTPLTRKGTPSMRVPLDQPSLSNGKDSVTFESYDDQDFGYLRIVVSAQQLRIEYHPATDGAAAKTPDDVVTVDLASYKLVAS